MRRRWSILGSRVGIHDMTAVMWYKFKNVPCHLNFEFKIWCPYTADVVSRIQKETDKLFLWSECIKDEKVQDMTPSYCFSTCTTKSQKLINELYMQQKETKGLQQMYHMPVKKLYHNLMPHSYFAFSSHKSITAAIINHLFYSVV